MTNQVIGSLCITGINAIFALKLLFSLLAAIESSSAARKSPASCNLYDSRRTAEGLCIVLLCLLLILIRTYISVLIVAE